jgi:hypothetical protein
MKIINSKLHAALDYLTVVFLLAAPELFNLPEMTAMFTYVLACTYFLLALITNFEFGLIKWLPFRVHGWVEVVVAFALIVASFYLGKTDGVFSRNFYLVFAAITLIVFILTDFRHSKAD